MTVLHSDTLVASMKGVTMSTYLTLFALHQQKWMKCIEMFTQPDFTERRVA